MPKPDRDLSWLTGECLAAWHGHRLPDDVAGRIGPDLAHLIALFQSLPPPPFDLQVHHFAPLLEALADD